MRNITLQGHSRRVAEQYYTIEEGDRSAYEVITGGESSILPPPEEDASIPLLHTPLPIPGPMPIMKENSNQLVSSGVPLDTDAMNTTVATAITSAIPRVNTLEVTPTLVSLVGQAVGLVRSHSTLMSETQQTSNKQMKFTLEGGVAGINARRDQIEAMPQPREIGIDHPCFESDTQRVPSSDMEKSWLFHYYSDAFDTDSSQGGNCYRDCLNAIRANDIARGVFHKRHVMSSDRLKTIALPVLKCVKIYKENDIEPAWLLEM